MKKLYLFKKEFVLICMAAFFVSSAYSQSKPSEIRTYRQLFNYAASSMQTYKDRPDEYVALIKDAITVLGNELDKSLSKKGEAWTNLSDKKEIENAVITMYFAIGSINDKKFNEKYKNINGKTFTTVLEKAFLYKAGGNRSVQTGILFDALASNNLGKVKACIDSGADINSKNGEKGYTPLIYAVKENKVDMVELLLKAKPDLNVADNNGRRAIHYAAYDGNWKTWELIANSGADVNVKDSEGRTPLMWVDHDCMDRAELLVKLGADVNARKNNGNTMLIDVCGNSNFGAEWVSFLIKSGADVNIKSNNGLTALETAMNWFQDENCKQKIALLRAAGAR